MKLRKLLALFVGASLILAAPAVFADDDDDDDDDAPKLQVIVNESGEILTAEDDAVDATRASVADPASVGKVDALSTIVPDESQPRQYSADGSSHAQVGREHFKYLVVTLDKNGETAFKHLTEDQLQDEGLGKPNSMEEE